MAIDFKHIEQAIDKIPPLPLVVSNVMTNLDGDAADFEVLEKNISQDPVMSGRILAVANSSFYGMSGKVGAIKDACLILGLNTIRSIIIAVGVIQHMKSGDNENLYHNHFWHHSIGVAVSARVLAKYTNVDRESAFTAGLLHDIGKLVLASCFSKEYAEIARLCDKNNCSTSEAEDKVIGYNHGVVGAKIAERWRLPQSIIDSIKLHHIQDEALRSPMVGLVYVADAVCIALETSDDDMSESSLDHNVVERLEMTMPMIIHSMDEIASSESGFSALMG